MKQRKIYVLGLALVLLLMMTAGWLVSCNGQSGSGATEIFIQNSQAPRLTYVQGQELDLSHGVLTVTEDGEQRSLPLDNAEITVTGYEKDTLGKQTLTVTYKGLTTTFEVTVIARATAENFETNYFIGDTFDNTKGRLKIAKDDGTTFTVPFDSEKVSVKSFDPTKEGSTTVTVVYTDGDASYECSFQVTVHKVDKVTLTPPKQTSYASHEKELNLAGGYLTVEAPAPSNFSKFVNLTPAMITGYEPEKVTMADRDKPVTQVLIITYAGQTFEFPVTISYSLIYLVEEVAKDLKDLDWTKDEVPEYSIEQGEAAADALKSFLTLSPADRALVDKDTLLAVARPATVYWNTVYLEASLSFEKVFTISPEGNITIVGETYEATQTAVEQMKDASHPFNTTAAILQEIKQAFSEEILLGTVPFVQAISAHTPENLDQLIPIFEYMLTTFDGLKDIPNDWTVDTLKNYETQITTATSKILISNYTGLGYNQFYEVISSWRENDDYFDIIYTYYYYIKDNGQQEILSNLWQKIPAPGIMNDWLYAYVSALTEANKLKEHDASQTYLYDVSGLMYYYDQLLILTKDIKNSGNELYLNLFDLLDAEEAIELHLRRSSYGYIFQMGEALGLSSVEGVWDVYIELIHAFLTEPADTLFSEHGAKFEAVTKAMAELSPAQLYAFVSTINFLYDSTPGTVLVLDCSVRPYNTLMNLLGNYYREVLPTDEMKNMFFDLFVAMENASLLNIKESAKQDFITAMGKVDSAYTALSDNDKATFNRYFGHAYTKYKTICGYVSAQSVTVPQNWNAKFEELKTLLDAFDTVYAYVTDAKVSDVDRSRATPVLFALYERAYRIYEEINAADDSISSILAGKFYTSGDLSYTMDRRFMTARNIFINLTISSGIDNEMAYDAYQNAGLQSFFADVAYLVWDEFNGKLYEGTDVATIMETFSALAPEKQVAAYKLGLNLLYYAGIERYYKDVITNTEDEAIISKLLEAEIAYTMYANDATSAYLNDFKAKMADVIDMYENLADRAAFEAVLGDMYHHYESLYNSL